MTLSEAIEVARNISERDECEVYVNTKHPALEVIAGAAILPSEVKLTYFVSDWFSYGQTILRVSNGRYYRCD